MIIRTIILDDEPLALRLMANYVSSTPYLELVAEFDNPLDALTFLADQKVDLIFTDIEMPDLQGTEFVKLVRAHGAKVVFTTAYAQYALEGFRLDVVDYLLKPFAYGEFLAAAQKAKNRIELEQKTDIQTEKIDTNHEFLFLKSEYKLRRINFSSILYIEGLKDYVKVYLTHEQKPILSLMPLKALDEKLPPQQFMRVHRSFIVNLSQIQTIDRLRIVFGDTYIPVGDQYKERFQEFVDKNFL